MEVYAEVVSSKRTIHTFTVTDIVSNVEPQLELSRILFVGQNVSQMPRTQFWAYQIRICSILFRVKHRLASSCEEPRLSDLVSTPWRPHHGVQILASIESSRNRYKAQGMFLGKRGYTTMLCCCISGTETRDVLLDLSKSGTRFFLSQYGGCLWPGLMILNSDLPPFDLFLKQGKRIVWRSRLLSIHVPLL